MENFIFCAVITNNSKLARLSTQTAIPKDNTPNSITPADLSVILVNLTKVILD